MMKRAEELVPGECFLSPMGTWRTLERTEKTINNHLILHTPSGTVRIEAGYELEVSAAPDLQMTREREGHDFELEPSDDSIAALQHEVATRRAKQVETPHVHCIRAGVLSALANARPMATEWLVAAALAMEAYEAERERERG